MERKKNIEELKKLQTEVIRKNRKCTAIFLIILIPILVASLLIVLNSGMDEPLILVPILFSEVIFSMCIFAIVRYFVVGKQANLLKQQFKSIFVLDALNRIFEDVAYTPDNGIPRSVIAETGMMTTGDRYSSNDFISAKYHGLPFEQSDIHIEEERETRDSDGNRETEWVTIFRGRWIIFDFPKKFLSDIQVVGRNFHGNRLNGRAKYERVKLEDDEFNKMFAVYSGDGLDVFYALPPDIMERMKELSNALGCGIMFCFIGNKLHIAINNLRDSFECNVFKEFDEEKIEKEILKDIRLITGLAEQLKLDKRIFRK